MNFIQGKNVSVAHVKHLTAHSLLPLQNRRNNLISLLNFLFIYSFSVCVLGKERQRERETDIYIERGHCSHVKERGQFSWVRHFLSSITWVLWTELKSSGSQWPALKWQFHGATSATQPESLHSTSQNLPCVSPSPCARFDANSPQRLIGPQLMELIEKIGPSLHWKGCVAGGGLWSFKSQWYYQLALFLRALHFWIDISSQLLLQHHSFLPTHIRPQYDGQGLWPSGTMSPWLNAFFISWLGHFDLSWQQNTKTPLQWLYLKSRLFNLGPNDSFKAWYFVQVWVLLWSLQNV